MIDRHLLSRIGVDAICNVRSYIKDPASLVCPPHCFPFEKSQYMLHLLLNKSDFLIPSICVSLGFHPLTSETYTNEDQQNEIILAHILTAIKLFISQRSRLLQ